MKIGVLGLGRMGAPIAHHLLRAGHEVAVWNRSPGKDVELVASGAVRATTPGAAAAEAEAVVLVLFGPDSVRDVLAGETGVLAWAGQGTLLVDTTTIGPSDARVFADLAAPYGLRYVDAPLFGSVDAALNGTVATHVGGSATDFADALPVVTCWCDAQQVVHAGPVGSGAAVKLVRNMGHGIANAAIGECLRLAADLGVPREVALATVADGPFSWSYGSKARAFETRDFSEVMFTLNLMAKDLALAVAESDRPLPVSRAALDQCRGAQAAGRGDEDFPALADWVEG